MNTRLTHCVTCEQPIARGHATKRGYDGYEHGYVHATCIYEGVQVEPNNLTDVTNLRFHHEDDRWYAAHEQWVLEYKHVNNGLWAYRDWPYGEQANEWL